MCLSMSRMPKVATHTEERPLRYTITFPATSFDKECRINVSALHLLGLNTLSFLRSSIYCWEPQQGLFKTVRSGRPPGNVAKVAVEDESSPTRSHHFTKRQPLLRASADRLLLNSTTSRSSSSHIPVFPRSTRTLTNYCPSLNIADLPPQSPTNKSPFSAVLLFGESEEDQEDDPVLALWDTEQLLRARLARHLGEETPADMVLAGPNIPVSEGPLFPRSSSSRGTVLL
ncbi:hypothetical protein BS17DRAFT_771514 [Gyrodon lividus]|nr:hypothetical protein BS17DRAFT_771514 [Gyrodon lividus]